MEGAGVFRQIADEDDAHICRDGWTTTRRGGTNLPDGHPGAFNLIGCRKPTSVLGRLALADGCHRTLERCGPGSVVVIAGREWRRDRSPRTRAGKAEAE